MFQDYVNGTNAQNIKRRQLGIEELFLDSWSEAPHYDKINHHLVWGLKGHTGGGVGSASGAPPSPVINFFTRILGRNGYLSVDLIDSPDRIEASKLTTKPALDATRFKAGFKYEDHKSSDRSSGIGLRTLVLGGVGIAAFKAVKGGALIGILLALKKAIIFIVAGIAGFFKWLFGRGKKSNDYVAQDPPADPGDGSSQV